jgi:hypothetical protein
VKATSTSNNWHDNGFNCPAADGFNPTVITFAGFARSTKITLVTPPTMSVPPGTSSVKQKHAPEINRSWNGTAQFPSEGVTLNTTGALVPKFNEHVVVRVNGPNWLLSPAVNVVVTVTVAGPPQHASPNPVPGRLANAGIVPLTRLQFTGVTFVNAIVASGIVSPFVSHTSVAAVLTVFPGLCSGIPVSVVNPWQMIVVSFGKNPHPTRFNCTAHNAFTNPVVVGVVTNGPVTTVVHSGFAGGVHPIPNSPTRPRFTSLCLALEHSTASFPSNLRSKSGSASVTSPPDPVPALRPSLNNSNSVASVPSPIKQFAQMFAVCPFVSGNTPNGFVSAAAAAFDRLISHNPGGFSGSKLPIEYPTITGLSAVPSKPIWQ